MNRATVAGITSSPKAGFYLRTAAAVADPASVAAGLAGDLAGVLHVLGVVRTAHAEAPLAAHVAGVLAGRDGEDLDLHVRIVQLGRHDHRLRTRGMTVLLYDVGPPHPLPLVDGHAALERHDAGVGLGHLEADIEGLPRHGSCVGLDILHPVGDGATGDPEELFLELLHSR